MSANRAISVCVDDYGLHEGVNEAAVELARKGRVSTISCLVDGPAFELGVAALRTELAHLEVGLHVNFTEDFGAGAVRHSLPALILLAYARRLEKAAVRTELIRQFERFESVMRRPPDFVDGHQHVHQLPVIRETLLDVMDQRYPQGRRPWLRATRRPERPEMRTLPLGARCKARLIQSLGAQGLARLAAARGYRQNRQFLGVYGFQGSDEQYLRHLRSWLDSAASGDLLVCHPSLMGEWPDSLLAARNREFRVLCSDACAELVAWVGVEVRPLKAQTSAPAG